MIAISTTELRKNLRKYLNIAIREKVIVQFGKTETFEIVPYCSQKKLLEVLKKGEEDLAAGKFTEIKDPKNIWASIP